MTILKNILLLSVLSLFLVACKSTPILNINNANFHTKDNIPIDNVTKGIIRAGTSLGWRMEEVKQGLIEGTLYLRTHMAAVNITYDTNSFSINYKDSTNLDHKMNGGDGKEVIHSNYNGWIQNLNSAIMREVY